MKGGERAGRAQKNDPLMKKGFEQLVHKASLVGRWKNGISHCIFKVYPSYKMHYVLNYSLLTMT